MAEINPLQDFQLESPKKAPIVKTKISISSMIAGFIAICAALVIVSPFVVMLTNSLMTLSEAFRFPPKFFPSSPQWQNYETAWNGAPFTRYFLNSIIVTSAITLGQLFTSVLAAYAFARMTFPGKNLLFGLFLATLMVPAQVVLIPNYLTLSQLNLINTYPALILPFLASGFSVFLIRQFFKGIPQELDDAARIDGATRWGILWRIYVPLSKPVIATAGLFIFLGEWNSYLWPLIVTDTDTMRTVQIGLASFQAVSEEEGLTHWPVILAASMLVLLPTLIAFLFTEKQLVKGITLSGLKG